MRAVIIPKSDQINADDLLGGPITITISRVTIRPGTEQGDNGKPYKPCKSMARVMVHCWGPDASAYTGRSMTLYCDPKVQWGGMAVGGIRISHLSHIPNAVTMALTATKGSRKPFTVKPLETAAATKEVARDKTAEAVKTLKEKLLAADSVTAMNAILNEQRMLEWRQKLAKQRPELEDLIRSAVAQNMERFKPADDETVPFESDVVDDFPGVVTRDDAELDAIMRGAGAGMTDAG
jgi:hypothetical protein